MPPLRHLPSLQHEEELRLLGFERIAGVDEVGRGALAGPVVAATVILPPGVVIDRLRDSKLVPEGEREELYAAVLERAVDWSVAIVPSAIIDRINVLQATLLAMRQAVGRLAAGADYVIVDGRDVPEIGLPCRSVIDGDRLCHAVAAASIVAKVTRDRIMRELDRALPGYLFARNKGYGTAEHRSALERLGATVIHRRSFLRDLSQLSIESIDVTC